MKSPVGFDHVSPKLLKDRYLWITFFITLLLCLLAFGEVMRSPDDYLFSTDGDGLQTYYQSIYHVKYDSTYMHQQGLNYPHGENIFFTGGQPLATNVVKFIQPVIDLTDHMVGITNWLMIFSVLICPLFLYLILKDLGMKPLVSILFAIGITFLSQQWERFGGHYPLGWLYAVPGMIWLLMKYHQSGAWKWTWIIAGYLTFLILAHIYYLVFFAVIAAGFWMAFALFNAQRTQSIWKITLQTGLQIVLPFLLLQWLMHTGAEVTDRTRIPWGFMVYRSAWGGYLFPYGMWYEHLFTALKPKNGVEWEGLAYVGGSVILMFVFLLFKSIFRWKKTILHFSSHENRIYLALAIAAILCIAVSFAFPFNYGLEKLLYKLGPVQQFRGIGRFAFVAFYLIEIGVIGMFFRLFRESKYTTWILASLFALLMLSEAGTRLHRAASGMRHERGMMLRNTQPLPGAIDVSSYQAILPFPFFHIGSENVGADAPSSMKNFVYDLSLRTGLPSFAASMSRTSISQSFDQLALAQEVMQMPDVLYRLDDDKAILVVCDTQTMLPHQKELIKHCPHLFDENGYAFYRLELDERVVMHNAYEWVLLKHQLELIEMDTDELYPAGEQTWTVQKDAEVYREDSLYESTFEFHWMRWKELDVKPTWRGRDVVISFYVENFRQDLLPRTVLEVVQKQGEKTTGYFTEFIGKRFVAMHGKDALIECTIPVDSTSEKLVLSFENKLITGQQIRCRDLQICPEGVDCLILRGEKRFLNNRNYQ